MGGATDFSSRPGGKLQRRNPHPALGRSEERTARGEGRSGVEWLARAPEQGKDPLLGGGAPRARGLELPILWFAARLAQ